MTGWILRRLLLCVPTLIGITLVTFVVAHLAPGGPLSQFTSEQSGAHTLTAEQQATLARLLELDRPLPAQYASWCARFVQLDFGTSLGSDRRAVRTKLWEAFRVSFGLQLAAIALIYLIGVPIGVWCAVRRGRLGERLVTLALFLLHSMPVVVLASLLLLLFCTGRFFGALPMQGLRTPELAHATGWTALADLLRHALLPVVCLALGGLAGISRYARAGLLEVLRQDYVVAARARGLPPWRVLRHALRNGLVPIVTLLGALFPFLVGGSVIVESIFAIPGMGRLAAEAVVERDYPTVMALSVFVGVATMIGFVVTDLLYVALDRRVRVA